MEKDENQDVELEEQNNEEEEVEDTEDVNDEEEESDDTPDWEAEAKKWKAIASRNKKKQEQSVEKKPADSKVELSDEDDEDLATRLQRLEQTEEKRRFGYEHKLSPEETDKVFQIDPRPTAKTLDDPFVKAGLQAIRKANRVDENTPSSSTKSTVYSSKKFNELSPQEKQKKHVELMKKKGLLN